MTNVPGLPPPPGDEPARQLIVARGAWKPVGRAIRYATFDATSLAVFAVVSASPCVGFGVVGLIAAVILGAAAAVEFVAVRRLRRLDSGAIRPLVVNQLALGLATVAYAGWNLYLTAQGRGLLGFLVEQVSTQSGTGLNAETMATVRRLVNVLYVSLAAVGPAWTGATAWFYASRDRPLRSYLANTPSWLLQMHREQGSI